MKKVIFTALMILTGLIVLQSFGTIGLGKKDGTEPGFTGSPGDSLKNCTACHGGSATNVAGWITSNIPTTGYIPGSTYRISATNTTIGHNRFGFSISPQAFNGTLLGKMELTDTIQTKFVGENNKYITYREAGVAGQDSKTWSFNWVAPNAGTGDVVFYGAFNSNHDGHKGGDLTQLSTLRVKENGTTAINQINNNAIFNVYPNPIKNKLNINLTLNKATLVIVNMYDLTGKNSVQLLNKTVSGEITEQFDVENVESGVKILKITLDSKIYYKRVVLVN